MRLAERAAIRKRSANLRASALAALCVGWSACALGDGLPPAEAEPTVAERPLEEMTVTARRVLSAQDRERIYAELAEARKLYSSNQIEAALPYLLSTAAHGFKDSQAKVGHIYLQGLGPVERNSQQAVGWLGVASSGTTSPTIRNYFNDVWERIPEHYVPHFEEVVDEFTRKYGERATGMVCKLDRPVRSHQKKLGCFFREDVEDGRRGLDVYKSAEESIDRYEELQRNILEIEEYWRRRGGLP